MQSLTVAGHAHGSSFLLQVLLHLNAYYIAFWFVLLFFMLIWKGLRCCFFASLYQLRREQSTVPKQQLES